MVNFKLALAGAVAAVASTDAACFDDWLADAANAAVLELNAVTSACCTDLVLNVTQTIPANIGTLAARLTNIDLSACNIGGILPDVSLLVDLNNLNLAGNAISGEISDELFELAKLTALDLSDNQIGGDIPSMDGLVLLSTLKVGDNDLIGRVPPSMGNVSTLVEIDVSSNGLSGPIPDSLIKLENLVTAKFADNRFHGPLPAFAAGVVLDITEADLTYLADGTSCEAAPTLCSSGENKCNADTKLCCTALEACLDTVVPDPNVPDPDADGGGGDNTGAIVGGLFGGLVVVVGAFVVFKKMNGEEGADLGSARKMMPSGLPKVPLKVPKALKARSGSSMDVERFDENYLPEGGNADEGNSTRKSEDADLPEGSKGDEGSLAGEPEIDLEAGGGGNFNPFSGKDTETDFSQYYEDGSKNQMSAENASDGGGKSKASSEERKVSI